MKKTIILLLFLTVAVSYSETFQNGWHCFDGTVGKTKVTVNIFCDSIGNLTGDYCYNRYETRIPIKGKLDGENVFLDEFTNGEVSAKFSGKIDEESNTIVGKWSSLKGSNTEFSIRLNSWTGNRLDGKYALSFEDEEIESFFRKAKNAILNNDKTWLSQNIDYPINVRIAKKYVTVNSPQKFIANYSKIITEEYKAKAKDACICNIFANWQGAMIGHGMVWINESKSQKLKIIAINN